MAKIGDFCLKRNTVFIAQHYMLRLNNKLNRFTKFIENQMKIMEIWMFRIDESTCDAINITLSANYPTIIVIFFNFFSTYHFCMCLLVKFSKRKERPNMRIAMKLLTTNPYVHTMWTNLTAVKYGSHCFSKNTHFTFFSKLFLAFSHLIVLFLNSILFFHSNTLLTG